MIGQWLTQKFTEFQETKKEMDWFGNPTLSPNVCMVYHSKNSSVLHFAIMFAFLSCINWESFAELISDVPMQVVITYYNAMLCTRVSSATVHEVSSKSTVYSRI